MKKMMVGFVILALLTGCQPPHPSGPGSGASAASNNPVPPGSHRVVLVLTVADIQKRPVSTVVHIVTLARTADGKLGIDKKTMAPIQHVDEITTPDSVPYDLQEPLTTLEVHVSTLARAGWTLKMDVRIDGALAPVFNRESSMPSDLNGMQTIKINQSIQLPI